MKRLVLAVLLVVPLNAYAAVDLGSVTGKALEAVAVPEASVPGRAAFAEEKGSESCWQWQTESECTLGQGWPHCSWDPFFDKCSGKSGKAAMPVPALQSEELAVLGAEIDNGLETDETQIVIAKAAGLSKQELCNLGAAILNMPDKSCLKEWKKTKKLSPACTAAAQKWARTHSYDYCKPGYKPKPVCPAGYYYKNGLCYPKGGGGGGGHQNSCAGVFCGHKMHCEDGRCVKDAAGSGNGGSGPIGPKPDPCPFHYSCSAFNKGSCMSKEGCSWIGSPWKPNGGSCAGYYCR